MTRRRRIVAWVFACSGVIAYGVVVSGGASERPAFAGPSDSQPEAGLEVRPFDGVSEGLARHAQRLYEQARRDIDRYRASQQRGMLGGESPLSIGATYVAALQLQRAAEHLKLRGEAAGYDYALRSSELQNQTRALAQEYSTLGRFSGEQLAARMEGLKRAGAARLPHVQSLAAAGRWEAADALMNAILDSLNQFAVFLGGSTSQYFQPFSSLAGNIKAQVTELRREAARADLLVMRERIAPDFETTLARCQAAVDEVVAKGSAVWIEPSETTGPRLVSSFFEEWKQTHLAALRTEAADWSWGGSPEPIRLVELASLRTAHGAFSKRMLELVAALIAADAQRSNPDAAPLLHAQYLEALAENAPWAPRAELLAHCEGPLAELAAKAPRLKERVAGYRAASGPLLYWRRRTAEARAASRLVACGPLPGFVSAHATVDAGQPGLMQTGFGLSSASLLSPAPAVMRRLAPVMTSAPVSCSDLTSTGGEGLPLAGRYRERTLPLVTRPEAASIAPAVLALESDLWADRKAPPLTLEAAIALRSARRGEMARAGGQITSLSLTPLLTHAIGAHDGAFACWPLGPLPHEPENLDLTSHVLVKATIAPEWVQHEAFFVQLR